MIIDIKGTPRLNLGNVSDSSKPSSDTGESLTGTGGTDGEVEGHLGILLLHVGEEAGFFIGGEPVCESCSRDKGDGIGQEAVDDQR